MLLRDAKIFLGEVPRGLYNHALDDRMEADMGRTAVPTSWFGTRSEGMIAFKIGNDVTPV